ncbi:unnamed protein product, partial [Rotaria sordida]
MLYTVISSQPISSWR